MATIRVHGVRKEYRLGKTVVHALRGVDLDVEPGELISIVGPSGCGKTTLLNLVGCIDRPTEGTIHIDGVDIAALSDDAEADLRLHTIGFIFQSFNLVPVLTVAENVALPMMLAGADRTTRDERARSLLEAVGIGEYAEHRPDELSGGQRQRVAVARALVNRPRVVIADEPTANLDSESGALVMDVMRRLNETEEVTLVFSTHDPDILRYANRVVRMRDGVLEQTDAP